MENAHSPESGLAPPCASSPPVKRKLHKESQVAPDTGKTLCVIFQTSGCSRIVSYTEHPTPTRFNCDAVQCCPSPPLKKANVPHIAIESKLDQPYSSQGCKNISLNRKKANELKHKKWNRNGGWHGRNRTSASCDPLSLASISQQTELEDVSRPNFNDNALGAPIQRLDSLSNLVDGPSLSDKVPNHVNLTHTDSMSNCDGSSGAQPEASCRNESTAVTNELLLEASATYRLFRKRKTDSINPSLTTAPDSQRPDRTSQKGEHGQTEHLAAEGDGLVGTAEGLIQKTPKLNCRLPFNGHREDVEHYRLCEIVSAGIALRQEHTNWLSGIPIHSEIMRVVNLITGSSCKQIMLNGKCGKVHCTSKHVIDLNFEIPQEQFIRVLNMFTKWFLQNAEQPDFKAILLTLSRLSEDSNDTLMTVLSFSKMMLRLSKRIHKQALGIKLIEIMVSILGYRPWEAIRALLIFTVSPETELPDILAFLSCLRLSKNQSLKNHLYESVSCLWHISESFVCQSELLFKLLKECLVQMPVDLKLTKDRMLVDLLKLPRCRLRKEFLYIDKFLSKYYPQNSKIAHVFRTSILYGVEVTKSVSDRKTYETSRVKGTGPVNPQWQYWDIQESRIKAFDLVVKNSRKNKPYKEMNLRIGPMCDLSKENLEVDVCNLDLFKMMASRNCLCYDKDLPCYDFCVEEPNDIGCLVDSLISSKFGKVVNIMLSCSKSFKADSFEKCLQTLQQEFELCDKALISLVVFEILKRLPGSLSDETSVKSCFVRMVNFLVVKFYKEADYRSAVKLLKAMRHAGVNHLEHAPKETDHQTFTIICSDINFQCRLYPDAIRSLMYKNCLNFVDDGFDRRFPEYFYHLEKLVLRMLKRFLKERHASHALDIFRLVFAAQQNLHFPLNIGKYYEGVIFLSFVSSLKKNACSIGDGASLYITVERICGNALPFHSITYRSLLVELHRANSPEDIIRRTLRICLKKKIYPDFSRGPISPLVLDSHLAREEMSIYLKHYFTYFIVQNNLQQLTDRPFVVRFTESPPPDNKLFPVSNDIMKTPRSIPDALERFKSVLDGFSSELNQALDVEFSRVTVPVQGVETLLRVFNNLNAY